MRFWTGVLFIAGGIFSSVAFSNELRPAHGGIVVENAFKNLSSIDIPVSSIIFAEANQNNPSGFYADKTISLTGRLVSQILDYPMGRSATEIFELFFASATKLGYEVIYECKAADCGKKDGYRAYFSTRLNDDTQTQHYLVVRKNSFYKSLYVAEIDGQPRSYFLDVSVGGSKADSVATQNLISFSSGNALLSASEKSKVDRWIEQVKSQALTITVFGTADAVGGLAANIKLAEDRANNVRAYLIAHHGIPAERVVSLSAANLARPLTGERGRYVELVAHSM